MEQRLSALTLGVEDLARARQFYEAGLGLTAHESSNGTIVFFQMNGFVLGLFGADALAEEAAQGKRSSGFGGIALAYNAKSKEDVDALLNTAVKAGATLVKPAEDAFWGGYSGYFADPDGHRWEIAWNPHWPIDDQGNTSLS